MAYGDRWYFLKLARTRDGGETWSFSPLSWCSSADWCVGILVIYAPIAVRLYRHAF